MSVTVDGPSLRGGLSSVRGLVMGSKITKVEEFILAHLDWQVQCDQYRLNKFPGGRGVVGLPNLAQCSTRVMALEAS